MVTSSSTNFYKVFYYMEHLQKNVANSSFHLVRYDNWTKTVSIFSTYKSVATNIIKVALF